MSSTPARRLRRKAKGSIDLAQPLSTEPRELKVIEQEYAQLCGLAGQVQYQILVLESELENHNNRLVMLNKEASAAKAKASAAPQAQENKEA